MKEITTSVFPVLATVTNFIIILICLPRKKSLKFTCLVYGTVIGVNCAVDFIVAGLGLEDHFRGIRGLIYLPFVICLFRGLFFQKVFAFFAPLTLTATMVLPAEMMARLFMRFGEFWYWLAMLLIPAAVLTLYILVIRRFGRGIISKLFSYGNEKDWLLYALSAVICYTVVASIYPMLAEYTVTVLLLIFFVFWCLIILCFAIITTQERAKQKYEADFAREIISSGRDYYDKLTDMTEKLHILRHDYKHHLASMQKMVKSGYGKEMQDYLEILNRYDDGKDIGDYCTSRMINALLDSFSERCKKTQIDFNVKIILPPAELVNDYELCIIIGNLLENAITACQRTSDNEKRYIDISMRPREFQYGIKVENSYDGVLSHEGKTLFSTKQDGGWGIKSIESIARQHNGEYVPVWDEKKFSAVVVLKLGDEQRVSI
jgi:signal transduction histidine kinase